MSVSGQGSQVWLIGILWAVQLTGQEFTISTMAGGVPPPTPAVAATASIGKPIGIATDPAGNVYFSAGYCVFKLNSAGILTLVAGNSHRGYSGDGGPATSAQLDYPRGLALDGAGNLYITDKMNNRIRRVSPSGTITTVAGTGGMWFAGDGGAATSATLYQPEDVAVDGAGNLYIADQMNNRIRRVSTAGIITTFAGTGDHGFSGDGGPATSAWLSWPSGIAADSAGHIYIADTENNRVRRVSPSGSISTVAADFARPRSLAVESTGNLLVTDTGRSRVVRVQFGGVIGIITVAGTGDAGFSGDGGPPISAQLAGPEGVAADAAGNVYIADTNNNRIRRILRPTPFFGGGISTVAGDGTNRYSGDGGPATSAQMAEPYGVAVDASGNLYITDHGNFSVRRVSPSGVITTAAAGPGISGMSGPVGVAADGAGNLYTADGFNSVHRVSPDGAITDIAASAGFNAPWALTLDEAGNLYVADMGRNRVVRVSPNGSFTTVAGTGSQGYSGDGGPATLARLSWPRGVAVDGAGNLYISDSGNYRLRRVSPDGTITTMAGTGTPGFSGDGGPAASAQLIGPTGVGLDGAGNIYIADIGNHRVRRISPSGTIATIAGTGVEGYSGDGVPAKSAHLAYPYGLAVDTTGRVYFSMLNAVRTLTPSCAVSATPNAWTPPVYGGTLTLTIQATPGCAWSITGLPAWITASAMSGWGPATVTLTVPGNMGAPRSATITAAGTAVTVTQGTGGGLCVASISPSGQAFSSAGGTGTFTVSTRAGCGWTAVSQAAWIAITSGSPGSGDGTVNYQVLPNSSAVPRSGTIAVPGSTFTVQQASGTSQCSYSISSTDLGVASLGGTVVLSLHAAPGCPWSIAGLPAWITVSGISQGSGSAELRLIVAANPNGARSATVSVGGVSVPILQPDATACGGSPSCVMRALPHLAIGGDWTTGLFAINFGASAGSLSVKFYDDNGVAVALPFTEGLGNLSTLTDGIPAQGRKDYEATNSSWPVQGGWGLVTADASVTTQLIFRRATSNGNFYEAAVPTSGGFSSFMIPFDATTFAPTGAPLYTGFAIANLNSSAAAHVTCTARDQWGVVIPDAITIPALNPSGHHANYLFPALTGKRGTVECTADTFVSAIALRFIGTDAFSTLPIIVK